MYFNIKCIGKLPGPTNEFERSLVFETSEFERPKFDCISLNSQNILVSFNMIKPLTTLLVSLGLSAPRLPSICITCCSDCTTRTLHMPKPANLLSLKMRLRSSSSSLTSVHIQINGSKQYTSWSYCFKGSSLIRFNVGCNIIFQSTFTDEKADDICCGWCNRVKFLVMPICDPQDRFFYPILTLMMDYYITDLWHQKKDVLEHRQINYTHRNWSVTGISWPYWPFNPFKRNEISNSYQSDLSISILRVRW